MIFMQIASFETDDLFILSQMETNFQDGKRCFLQLQARTKAWYPPFYPLLFWQSAKKQERKRFLSCLR
ncbi:MAG TPA: hypothetical protein DEQ85_09860 [Clostridiales bacterium]|nr:hypothetical protein [Clostridiales bacterium]